MASSIVLPCPIRIPALLLRECMEAQVTIRSPIPESPVNVSGLPPMATPKREISAIPLVIRAAFVLSPQPSPSAIPAASATTFFSAAPTSMPRISGLVYTRKYALFIKIFWIYSAVCFVFAPTTQVVGISFPTSSAWEGPDNTATSACGISCSMIWDKVISVCSSIPFATLTMICPSATYSHIDFAVLLVKEEGTASTSRPFPSIAFFKSVVNSMLSGSFTPGSLSTCSCFSCSIFTSASIIDHTITSCPLFASSLESAVPQLPAPITPIFAIF